MVKQLEINSTLLNSYIERIERLEEEKRELNADVREIYSEARGNGLEPQIMREMLKLRKMTVIDRAEAEFLRESYKKLIGISD